MIYLFGASGQGKVVLDTLKINDEKMGGFFDDRSLPSFMGFSCVHFPGKFDLKSDKLIVSVGDNHGREKISVRLSKYFDLKYAVAIHPFSFLSKSSFLGQGTVMMAGAIINADSRIGQHCIINSGASIDHDCVVEDFVHIGPGAVLCGNIFVGKGTLVGAGATLIPNVRIGRGVVIGAGSVVTKNISDHCLAVGNPARIIKTKS